MLKNYFKIAVRNLWKNKGYSAINIFGLAIGLCTCLLIALYITDELGYDRFYKNADRIFRINTDVRMGGANVHMAQTSDMMGQLLKKDYPQVEEYTRLYSNEGNKFIKKGNEFIDEKNVANADSTFFNVFTLPALEGDTKTALNEPYTLVINESTAKKYFGTSDAVGKMIETNENNSTLYKVTAVIKDIPHNSHFNFDFIFSMDNVQYPWGNFLSMNHQTYIVLKEGTDYKAFEKNFEQVIDKYVLPQAKEYMNIASMDEFEKAGNKLGFSLMPLTDIHLHSDRTPELGVNGNIQYVYIFSAVALFILLIACINFMNLSTARSSGRAKEVGIRKVLGTEKMALVRQFLTESIIMAVIAMLFAVIISWLTLSVFNNISGKSLSIGELLKPQYLLFLLILPFAVGALAGIYPAFYLSSFRPIVILKGKINAGFKRSNLRNALVIFQFTTSIILIIGTIIVYRQLNFIQNTKLGFNKDQLLVINGTGALKSPEAFKTDVSKMAGVNGATFSGFLPVGGSSRTDNTYSKEAVMDSKNGLNMQSWTIDQDYINVMGMEMIKGRNFSKEFGTDSSAMIINETTARLLGYENPVGKKLYTYFQDQFSTSLISYNIIGVVKNFHFESLKQTIGPLCFRMGISSSSTSFKVTTTDIKSLVSNVENKWKTMAPGMPFSYQFLDEAFNNMYRNEQRIGTVAITFAILSILIACLGLFGLATYMAEQRTKEIGVRKVLGASVGNIVSMLSKNFLKLVIISSIIAFPVSWWAMHRWLQDFAFRISIGWWVFVVAGVAAIVIALITISFQAVKAAIVNPVKSLRTE